jgi:hypothetical protein
MCVLERSSPLLTVSWAVPLAFELLVLAMTCWNAVDRPRDADMPLPRVLRKDGIIFFIVRQPKPLLGVDPDQVGVSQVMTGLRATNLAVVATERPALVLLTSLYVPIPALLHPLYTHCPQLRLGPGDDHAPPKPTRVPPRRTRALAAAHVTRADAASAQPLHADAATAEPRCYTGPQAHGQRIERGLLVQATIGVVGRGGSVGDFSGRGRAWDRRGWVGAPVSAAAWFKD